jgi:2-polyprenyl-6-methoxyphenol hydroxylase-like FAD-dependent oxidoreductase
VTADRRCDVIVVGAGIAGLTAAIALDRQGISVQIIERATALTQAGTALSIWPNALAALSGIGLADAIADIGYEEPTAIIREWSGRELVKVDQSRLYRHLGRSTLIVHRTDLQRLLLDASSHIPMRMRSLVEHVATEDGGGVVEMAHAETLRASVVLACDGIHSVARTVTDNPLPTYTGRTSWRAVLDDVPELVPHACLSVGQGKQFIASPMRGGSTYWAADVAMPKGANDALTDRRGFLLDSFAGGTSPSRS